MSRRRCATSPARAARGSCGVALCCSRQEPTLGSQTARLRLPMPIPMPHLELLRVKVIDIVNCEASVLGEKLLSQPAGELQTDDRFQVCSSGEAPLACDARQGETMRRPESLNSISVVASPE